MTFGHWMRKNVTKSEANLQCISRALNHVVDSLKKVSVEESTTVVLHQRQFEHRQNQNGGADANGHSLHLSSFKISKVRTYYSFNLPPKSL